MIKPRKRKKGSVVTVLSPSWGGPSKFALVYEAGLQTLQSLGLVIREYPTARMDAQEVRDNPKLRAQDINDAFSDPEIDAIIPSIGGDDSVLLLEYLDTDVIKRNPKLLIGYSDTATITTFLNSLGIVSYNGSSIMSGFAQYSSLGKEYQDHIKSFLFENPSSYEYNPYPRYSDGYPDWAGAEKALETSKLKPHSGWHWLQGTSTVSGELYGGCIEVFEFLKSTKY